MGGRDGFLPFTSFLPPAFDGGHASSYSLPLALPPNDGGCGCVMTCSTSTSPELPSAFNGGSGWSTSTSPELPSAFNGGSGWSTSTSPELPSAFNGGSGWSTSTSPELPPSFDARLGWSLSPELRSAFNGGSEWSHSFSSELLWGRLSSTFTSTHRDKGPIYSTIACLAVALGSHSTTLSLPSFPVNPSLADSFSVGMLLLNTFSVRIQFAAIMNKLMYSCWMWELSGFLFQLCWDGGCWSVCLPETIRTSLPCSLS